MLTAKFIHHENYRLDLIIIISILQKARMKKRPGSQSHGLFHTALGKLQDGDHYFATLIIVSSSQVLSLLPEGWAEA